MGEKIRKTGIDILGDVPWGTHFCQFYQTKEDLIDILVPYFKAGLENNEFCMWITSELLGVKEVKAALKKKVKNLDDHIKKGQIEILDYSQWYTKSGKFEADKVLEGWVKKENQALKRGFDGLRLTGNTFWLEKRDWKNFTNYEEAVNNVIGKYRMLALCTYSLDKCVTSEVIDVVSNHQFALIRREGKWKLIESSERKKAEEALKESEEKYRDLVEKAGIAIVIDDKEGNFKYLNKKFADLFGYSVEEMKNQSIQTLVHPEDARWVMEFHKARHHSEKIPLRYEFKGVRKDGSTIYLEIDVVKLKEGKSTVGTRAYIWDITDRKMAEEALRESEEKLRSLVVNTSDAIISVNTQGNIVFWNPAAENIFGYSSDQAIGKPYEFTLPKRFHIAFKKNFKQIVFWKKLGIIDNRAEMIGLRKDGREFPMEVSLSSGIIKEGIFFSGIIRDISERKKATDEPRKTYADLKKHNKS